MNAPPSMDVWTGDLARSTAAMSAEVYGAYMRLIFYQWEHGMIPRHVDDRHRVCGVTPERWDAVWARIAGRFEPLDDDGNLGHPRTTRERPLAIAKWKRNKEIAKKRQTIGRQGGFSKASKTLANAKQLPDICSSKKLANLEVEVEEGSVFKGKEWPYKSEEFLGAWKIYQDHCFAIGGVTQQKLDVDLMTLCGFQNEAKAVRWLTFSVQVSKAGNLCDPDRFQHAPGSEAAETRARRKDYRSMTAGEKKHAEKLRRERIVRGGREHGLSDEHIGALLKEAGLSHELRT